jgi:hypothetical protein
MDPPDHSRLTSHEWSQGGPLKIVSGDYTMLAVAQAEGIAAVLTPAELTVVTEE